jgi:ribosome biogenesis protein SSF1/2
MVIHLGEVGAAVKELCSDLRDVLSPYTFSKLKVFSKNKLHHFTDVATPLGAKMLLLLRSKLDHTTLALTRFPRGPTLYFNVLRYASIHDVHQGLEESATVNKNFRSEPFLVLDGFTTSDEDQVIVSMFQGLFPSIALGGCDLSVMKRVLIASKGEDGVISLRHYRVHKRDIRVNTAIRAIAEGHIPDLSDYESIDDFVLEGLAKKAPKAQCAIHLLEIGPRVDLTFDHVETGVFGGMKLTEVEQKPEGQKQYRYRSPSQRDKSFKRRSVSPSRSGKK